MYAKEIEFKEMMRKIKKKKLGLINLWINYYNLFKNNGQIRYIKY